MKNLAIVSYWIVALILGSLVNAFIIFKLWAWILVPTLGLPSIDMGAAYGLSVLLAFFKGKKKEDKEDDAALEITKVLGTVFFRAAVYLTMGYIASTFI